MVSMHLDLTFVCLYVCNVTEDNIRQVFIKSQKLAFTGHIQERTSKTPMKVGIPQVNCIYWSSWLESRLKIESNKKKKNLCAIELQARDHKSSM